MELVLEGGRAFGTGEHPTTSMYVFGISVSHRCCLLHVIVVAGVSRLGCNAAQASIRFFCDSDCGEKSKH